MAATSTPQYLHIRIEGSFCVVIQKNDSYRIRACTMAHKDHLFAINGELIDYKPGKSFHFELKPDGLATYNSLPDIDPAFDWSKTDTSKWNNDDSYYFITMDLPCPAQIIEDRTARVTFGDDSKGLMPGNHILVYKILDFDEVEILSKDSDPPDTDIDDNGIFQLELGLPPDTSADVRKHTIMFYNGMLQKLFPDLYNQKKYLLKDIQVPPRAGIRIDTTTLECKSGGMIVGFPQ